MKKQQQKDVTQTNRDNQTLKRVPPGLFNSIDTIKTISEKDKLKPEKNDQQKDPNDKAQERQQWLIEEDILITVFVDKFGTKRWNVIAEELKSRIPGSKRNGKQCRERWHNHLDPKVRKSPWNLNEEYVFIEAHKIHGNKWAEIAKYIPGRTDNSLKNHFYSTLRKLISRLQKFVISNQTFSDYNTRNQTAYFIEYLRKIMNLSRKQGNQDEINGRRNSYKRKTSIVSQLSVHANDIELAQFDIYLIRKLKQNNITLKDINKYLMVLKEIKEAQENLQIQDQKKQVPNQEKQLLGKRPIDGLISSIEEFEAGKKYIKIQEPLMNSEAFQGITQDADQQQQDKPQVQIIFRIEKDSQRLIEREIMNKRRLQNRKNSIISMQSSMNPSINISNMNMSAENVNLRIRDIVERKAILDAEYIKEIDPKKNRHNLFCMLKQAKITKEINKDGILDDFLAEMKKEQFKPQFAEPFNQSEIKSPDNNNNQFNIETIQAMINMKKSIGEFDQPATFNNFPQAPHMTPHIPQSDILASQFNQQTNYNEPLIHFQQQVANQAQFQMSLNQMPQIRKDLTSGNMFKPIQQDQIASGGLQQYSNSNNIINSQLDMTTAANNGLISQINEKIQQKQFQQLSSFSNYNIKTAQPSFSHQPFNIQPQQNINLAAQQQSCFSELVQNMQVQKSTQPITQNSREPPENSLIRIKPGQLNSYNGLQEHKPLEPSAYQSSQLNSQRAKMPLNKIVSNSLCQQKDSIAFFSQSQNKSQIKLPSIKNVEEICQQNSHIKCDMGKQNSNPVQSSMKSYKIIQTPTQSTKPVNIVNSNQIKEQIASNQGNGDQFKIPQQMRSLQPLSPNLVLSNEQIFEKKTDYNFNQSNRNHNQVPNAPKTSRNQQFSLDNMKMNAFDNSDKISFKFEQLQNSVSKQVTQKNTPDQMHRGMNNQIQQLIENPIRFVGQNQDILPPMIQIKQMNQIVPKTKITHQKTAKTLNKSVKQNNSLALPEINLRTSIKEANYKDGEDIYDDFSPSINERPQSVTMNANNGIKYNNSKLEFMQSIFDETKTKNYISQLNKSLANSKTCQSNYGSHGSMSKWGNGKGNRDSNQATIGNLCNANQSSINNQLKNNWKKSVTASQQASSYQKSQFVPQKSPINEQPNFSVPHQKDNCAKVSQKNDIQEQISNINKQIQEALSNCPSKTTQQNNFARRRSISHANILNMDQLRNLQELQKDKNQNEIMDGASHSSVIQDTNQIKKYLQYQHPQNKNIVDPNLLRIHQELNYGNSLKRKQTHNNRNKDYCEETLKMGSNASFYYQSGHSTPSEASHQSQQIQEKPEVQNQQKMNDSKAQQNQFIKNLGQNLNLKELTSQYDPSVRMEYPNTGTCNSAYKSCIQTQQNLKIQTIKDQNQISNESETTSLVVTPKPDLSSIQELIKTQLMIKNCQDYNMLKLAKLEQVLVQFDIKVQSLQQQSQLNEIIREHQQIFKQMREDFIDIDAKKQVVQTRLDAITEKLQAPDTLLPKIQTVDYMIEKIAQSVSSTKSPAMDYSEKKDKDSKIMTKMFFKQPEIQKAANQNSKKPSLNTTKQPQSIQIQFSQTNRHNQNQNNKKSCVPSKFAQNQNHDMDDSNSSSSQSNTKMQDVEPKQNNQASYNMTAQNKLMNNQQFTDKFGQQGQRKQFRESSLFKKQVIRESIELDELELGIDDGSSHSLSSSNSTPNNQNLYKFTMDGKVPSNINRLESDSNSSSSSINNVPQSSVPKLAGLNQASDMDSYNTRGRSSLKPLGLSKSYDVAMESQYNSNYSYNKRYLETKCDKGPPSISQKKILKSATSNQSNLNLDQIMREYTYKPEFGEQTLQMIQMLQQQIQKQQNGQNK